MAKSCVLSEVRDAVLREVATHTEAARRLLNLALAVVGIYEWPVLAACERGGAPSTLGRLRPCLPISQQTLALGAVCPHTRVWALIKEVHGLELLRVTRLEIDAPARNSAQAPLELELVLALELYVPRVEALVNLHVADCLPLNGTCTGSRLVVDGLRASAVVRLELDCLRPVAALVEPVHVAYERLELDCGLRGRLLGRLLPRRLGAQILAASVRRLLQTLLDQLMVRADHVVNLADELFLRLAALVRTLPLLAIPRPSAQEAESREELASWIGTQQGGLRA